MSGWRKTWPARLVSTVTALALVFACTFGLYAHAAGHHRYHTAQQAAQVEGEHGSCHKTAGHGTHGHVGSAYIGHDHAGPGPAGHDGGDADTSAGECCGMLCHVGHAILVAAAVIPHPVPGSPIAQAATALHSAPPGGLERPPKPSVPA